MSSGIWAAAAGAVSQVSRLDTAANNLANLDTPGFQVDRLVFRRKLEGSLAGHRAEPSLEYAVARSQTPDMTPNRIVPTGRALDLAILDNGNFFAVESEHGVRYTRAGNLEIMPDGTLATPKGEPYLDVGGRPMSVPVDSKDVRFNANGELILDGETSGQRLQVVHFETPEQLSKEGSLLLKAPPSASRSLVRDPYLQTEALEKATDRAFEHMEGVIDASRNFSLISQVIQSFKDIETSAARDIAGT